MLGPEPPGVGNGFAVLGGGAGGAALELLLFDLDSFLDELESCELFLLSKVFFRFFMVSRQDKPQKSMEVVVDNAGRWRRPLRSLSGSMNNKRVTVTGL